MNRRDFLKSIGLGAAVIAVPTIAGCNTGQIEEKVGSLHTVTIDDLAPYGNRIPTLPDGMSVVDCQMYEHHRRTESEYRFWYSADLTVKVA